MKQSPKMRAVKESKDMKIPMLCMLSEDTSYEMIESVGDRIILGNLHL